MTEITEQAQARAWDRQARPAGEAQARRADLAGTGLASPGTAEPGAAEPGPGLAAGPRAAVPGPAHQAQAREARPEPRPVTTRAQDRADREAQAQARADREAQAQARAADQAQARDEAQARTGRTPVGWGVTLGLLIVGGVAIAGVGFLFSFGDIKDLAVSVHVPDAIAPLISPTFDLGIIVLMVVTQWLSINGGTVEELRGARKLLMASGAATLIFNSAPSFLAGLHDLHHIDWTAVQRGVMMAAPPALLIAWTDQGPRLLRVYYRLRAEAQARAAEARAEAQARAEAIAVEAQAQAQAQAAAEAQAQADAQARQDAAEAQAQAAHDADQRRLADLAAAALADKRERDLAAARERDAREAREHELALAAARATQAQARAETDRAAAAQAQAQAEREQAQALAQARAAEAQAAADAQVRIAEAQAQAQAQTRIAEAQAATAKAEADRAAALAAEAQAQAQARIAEARAAAARELPEAPVSPPVGGPRPQPAGGAFGFPDATPALEVYGLDELMAMIPAELLAKAREKASTWDVRAEFEAADRTLPGWLTGDRCPTKSEVIAGTGRGSTAGGIMRQMIDDLRARHSQRVLANAGAD